MMHYLRTPLALLVLGAAINISVALGCSAFLHPHDGAVSFQLQSDAEGHAIAKTTIKRFGRTRESVHPAQARNIAAPFAKAMGHIQWLTEGERGSADYAGWPLTCVTCRNDRDALIMACDEGWVAFDGDKSRKLSGGFRLAPWAAGSGGGMTPTWRAIPMKPVWVGMMLNTVFFAILLSPIWLGNFAIRRLVRIRHNRCLACGYPIGVSPVCTECGRLLRRMRRRANPVAAPLVLIHGFA